jgi:UDP-N-acetylglucosamine diphosphorylase/glucosamine-1-phosphate N-acetyltransferase
MSLAALIMAAGKGKRMMNPDVAKVMYTVGGTPMIGHAAACARRFGAERVIAIVGHQRDSVIDYLRKADPGAEFAVQAEQLGTGHAVRMAEPLLREFDGDVVILSGDVPLLRSETVVAMIARHREKQASVTVLTAVPDDPFGYGRVIRAADGSIEKIVEQKDASPEEQKVREINSGIYVFQAKPLFSALARVTNANAQGEYYLPDVFEIFAREGLRREPWPADSFDEIRGANTREQLQELEALFLARK